MFVTFMKFFVFKVLLLILTPVALLLGTRFAIKVGWALIKMEVQALDKKLDQVQPITPVKPGR